MGDRHAGLPRASALVSPDAAVRDRARIIDGERVGVMHISSTLETIIAHPEHFAGCAMPPDNEYLVDCTRAWDEAHYGALSGGQHADGTYSWVFAAHGGPEND